MFALELRVLCSGRFSSVFCFLFLTTIHGGSFVIFHRIVLLAGYSPVTPQIKNLSFRIN